MPYNELATILQSAHRVGDTVTEAAAQRLLDALRKGWRSVDTFDIRLILEFARR